MLNRRSFLSILGLSGAAVAVEQAIPFGRVWSFPNQIVIAHPCSVRFVRAYDPLYHKMVSRLDVLYGWGTVTDDTSAIPGIENLELVIVPSESLVQGTIERMASKHGIANLPHSDHLKRSSKDDPEIRGFWSEEYLPTPDSTPKPASNQSWAEKAGIYRSRFGERGSFFVSKSNA